MPPLATALQGSCSCGWRGVTLYPLDWQEVADAGRPDLYETEGPEGDWDQHITDTEAHTVPDDITALITQLRTRLDVLAAQAPLAALKVVGALERTSADAGRAAACTALDDMRSPPLSDSPRTPPAPSSCATPGATEAWARCVTTSRGAPGLSLPGRRRRSGYRAAGGPDRTAA